MHQIAFQLGPLKVHWYGIMVALGYLSSVLAMLRMRRFAGLDSEQVFDLSMITIVLGILGARIFYVIQFWGRGGFADDPLQIIRIDKGGLVFYGGFICAILGVWIYIKRKKLSVLGVLDMMAPALAVGHAFGRIGCFLQGCCFGTPTNLPWAVSFPVGTLPTERFPDLVSGATQACSAGLHPVQLYESISLFTLFGILMLFGGRLKPGCLAALYLTAYGFIRFSLEFFRGDHTDFFMGILTPSQVISISFLIPCGVILFIYLWRRKDATA